VDIKARKMDLLGNAYGSVYLAVDTSSSGQAGSVTVRCADLDVKGYSEMMAGI